MKWKEIASLKVGNRITFIGEDVLHIGEVAEVQKNFTLIRWNSTNRYGMNEESMVFPEDHYFWSKASKLCC